MKCPLLIMNAPAANWGEGTEFADCLQEECAWWIQEVQLCPIKYAALELQHIHHRLSDLSDKIVRRREA